MEKNQNDYQLSVCKANGSHLWMDMEIFGFEHPDKDGPQAEGYSKILPDGTEDFVHVPLIPQNIETSIESLKRINQLEFTVAFQYPGLMCHPEAKNRLGGDPAVKYFEDYKKWIIK